MTSNGLLSRRAVALGLAVSPLAISKSLALWNSVKINANLAVSELFGVSHPDQVLAFTNSAGLDPSEYKLTENSVEVPYQVEGGNILVRISSGLPANTTRTWSWVKAAASAAAQVGVTDPGSNYLLIDNGIIAVRVAKAISVFSDAHLGTTPSNAFYIDHTGPLPDIPIPIQGVRHVDGTWTATDGRKFLTSYYQTVAEGQIWQALPATAMTTTIVENGPLRAVVEVLYTGPRVARIYNSITYDGIEDAYYKCTITLEAGQPCFIVKDDTNWGILKYNFNMNVGVNADVYRYRGHHAAILFMGILADGATVYPAVHSRNPDYDAEALLSPSSLHVWYNGYPIGYPALYNWYTWGANGGYYYHCANKSAEVQNVLVCSKGQRSRWK